MKWTQKNDVQMRKQVFKLKIDSCGARVSNKSALLDSYAKAVRGRGLNLHLEMMQGNKAGFQNGRQKKPEIDGNVKRDAIVTTKETSKKKTKTIENRKRVW